MNRIKRISMQLLNKYSDLFTTDFEHNKETLSKVAIFRSKGLRNEVAGYITNYVRGGMEDGKDEAVAEEVAAAEDGESDMRDDHS